MSHMPCLCEIHVIYIKTHVCKVFMRSMFAARAISDEMPIRRLCLNLPINICIIAICNASSAGRYFLSSSFTCTPLPADIAMPRNRDVIIAPAVRGVREVVVKHTKTKQGTVRTTETVVPIVLPKQRSLGQSSNAKKREKPQTQHENIQQPEHAAGTIGGTEDDPCLDDQEYLFSDPDPGPGVEESLPRTVVCL